VTEKTHKPTALRHRSLRAKGLFPSATLLVSAVGYVAALPLAPYTIRRLVEPTRAYFLAIFANPNDICLEQILPQIATLSLSLFGSGLLLLAVAGGASVLFQVVQRGGIVSRAIRPFARLRAQLHANRRLATPGAYGTPISRIVATIVPWAAIIVLTLCRHPSIVTPQSNVSGLVANFAALASPMLWSFGYVLLALGGISFLFSVISFHRDTKMTRAEVERDIREQEGSPEHRAARRRLRKPIEEPPSS